MATLIRRDILLAIRTEADNAGITAALLALEGLEKRVRNISSGLVIKFGFSGAAGVEAATRSTTQGIAASGQAAKAAQADFKAFGQELLAKEKQFDVITKKTKEINTTLGSGQTRQTTVRSGGGLTSRVTTDADGELIRSDLTVDLKKVEAERRRRLDEFGRSRQGPSAAAQKDIADLRATSAATKEAAEAERERIRGLTEKRDLENNRQQGRGIATDQRRDLDLNRIAGQEIANIQKRDLENNRIHGNEIKRLQQRDLENNRLAGNQIAIEQKRDVELNKIHGKEIGHQQELQRLQAVTASSADVFQRVRATPGVQEAQGPERVTKSGQIVRDTFLFDQQGRVLSRLDGETKVVKNSTAAMTSEFAKSGDTLQTAAGKVLLWTVATTAIFGTFNLLRRGVGVFAEIEKGTVSLARVGRGFSSSNNVDEAQIEIAEGARLATAEILKLKVAFGSTGTEALDAAVTFARLGLSQREVVEATRVSLLAANVAGIGAGQAAKFLAAAMSQFNLSVRDLPNALDKLNFLENTTKVRTEDLLNSISRAGAVVREAGGSFEFLAATTAVVSQATGRSGAEIGNAFKTIASRLGDARIQSKLFESTGIQVRSVNGQLLPINDILGQLVVKFQNLSDAERVQVTTSIAGVRQRNILQTALDNYFQVQAKVIGQLTQANSAEAENAQILTQLSTKANQFIAALERLAVTIAESFAGQTLKFFIEQMTNVVNTFSDLGGVGVAILGLMAAYVVAVVIASSQNGLLAGTFKALGTGITEVNTRLFGMVGGLSAQTAAARAATAANAQLAASQAAVGLGSGAANFATAGAAASAVTATSSALLPTLSSAMSGIGTTLGAGAAAVLGSPALLALIGAGIAFALYRGARALFGTAPKDFLDPTTEEGKSLANAGKRVTQQKDLAKAFEETAKVTRTASEVLAAQEAKLATGAKLTNNQFELRKSLMKELSGLSTLPAATRDRLSRGVATSDDLAQASQASTDEAVRARQASKQAQEAQLAELNKAIEDKRAEISTIIKKNQRNFGAVGFEFVFNGFTTADRLINDAREQIKELENQAEKVNDVKMGDLNKEIQEQVTDALEEAAEKAKVLLKDIEGFSRLKAVRLSLTAGNDVEKAQLEVTKLNKEIKAIINDPVLRDALRFDNTSKEGVKVKEELQSKIQAKDIAEEQAEVARVTAGRERQNTALKRRNDLEVAHARTLASLSGPSQFSGLREAIAEETIRSSQKDRTQQRLRDLDEQRKVAEASRQAAIDASKTGEFTTASTDQARVDAEAKLQLIAEKRANAVAVEAQQQAALEDAIQNRKLRTLEIVQRQTEEYRKQGELIRDAFSNQSDEELAQTQIRLGQIARGEFKEISRPEFNNLSEGTRKSLAEFDKLFPGANAVPQIPDDFARNLRIRPEPFERQRDIDEAQERLRRGPIFGRDDSDQTQKVPDSAKASTIGISVNADGLEVPLTRIQNALALTVEGTVGQKLNEFADRLENMEKRINSKGGGFKVPARN